ncbi:MAG: HAD hydrolase family protein [Aquisalimonadaceae bacterium]
MLPHFFDTPGSDVLGRAAAIRLLVLDVDGVLTDGTVYYGADGEMLKGFSILDGLGIRLLLDAGIEVAIISARDSAPLRRRAADLGITRLSLGRHDKKAAWQTLLKETSLPREQAAFVGDDLIDLQILGQAGLSVTVPNGHPLLLERCHWQTRNAGGHGAVREVCELILAAQGLLDQALRSYLDE